MNICSLNNEVLKKNCTNIHNIQNWKESTIYHDNIIDIITRTSPICLFGVTLSRYTITICVVDTFWIKKKRKTAFVVNEKHAKFYRCRFARYSRSSLEFTFVKTISRHELVWDLLHVLQFCRLRKRHCPAKINLP